MRLIIEARLECRDAESKRMELGVVDRSHEELSPENLSLSLTEGQQLLRNAQRVLTNAQELLSNLVYGAS